MEARIYRTRVYNPFHRLPGMDASVIFGPTARQGLTRQRVASPLATPTTANKYAPTLFILSAYNFAICHERGATKVRVSKVIKAKKWSSNPSTTIRAIRENETCAHTHVFVEIGLAAVGGGVVHFSGEAVRAMSAQLPTALSLIYRDRVRSCPAAKVPRGRPDEGVAPGNWWSVFAPTESIGPIVLWLLFIESLRSTVQARPCSDATVATAVAANLAAHIAATVPEGMEGMSEERERRECGTTTVPAALCAVLTCYVGWAHRAPTPPSPCLSAPS